MVVLVRKEKGAADGNSFLMSVCMTRRILSVKYVRAAHSTRKTRGCVPPCELESTVGSHHVPKPTLLGVNPLYAKAKIMPALDKASKSDPRRCNQNGPTLISRGKRKA